MKDKLEVEEEIINLLKIQEHLDGMATELNARLNFLRNKLDDVKNNHEPNFALNVGISDLDYIDGITKWSRTNQERWGHFSILDTSILTCILTEYIGGRYYDSNGETDNGESYDRIYEFLRDKDKVLSVDKLDLTLCNVALTSIPEELSYFKNLEKLILPSRIDLICIPFLVRKLPKLYHLQIDICGDTHEDDLSELLASLASIKSITKLSLKFLGGARIPYNISDFRKLTHLEIQFNYSGQYLYKTRYWPDPDLLSRLTKLKVLSVVGTGDSFDWHFDDDDYLAHCVGSQNFFRVPEEIGCLGSLECLTISVPLDGSSLPSSIGQLINLRRLDLSWCDLSSIPDSISNLLNLELLNLSNNHIKDNQLDISCFEKLTDYYPSTGSNDSPRSIF